MIRIRDLTLPVGQEQTSLLYLAAQALHVTPGAVGQQISKLEAWLGAPLFVRGVRQIEPTAEAQHYWAVVQPALARIQQALAARGQRLINRFALGGDVFEKVLLLGKAGFDFFKLRQQAGERVVALLGRVGQLQRVFDGLGEQLELRTKFGPLLGRA